MIFFYSGNEASRRVSARIRELGIASEFRYIDAGKHTAMRDKYNISEVPALYDPRNGTRCIGGEKCLAYFKRFKLLGTTLTDTKETQTDTNDTKETQTDTNDAARGAMAVFLSGIGK